MGTRFGGSNIIEDGDVSFEGIDGKNYKQGYVVTQISYR